MSLFKYMLAVILKDNIDVLFQDHFAKSLKHDQESVFKELLKGKRDLDEI